MEVGSHKSHLQLIETIGPSIKILKFKSYDFVHITPKNWIFLLKQVVQRYQTAPFLA